MFTRLFAQLRCGTCAELAETCARPGDDWFSVIFAPSAAKHSTLSREECALSVDVQLICHAVANHQARMTKQYANAAAAILRAFLNCPSETHARGAYVELVFVSALTVGHSSACAVAGEYAETLRESASAELCTASPPLDENAAPRLDPASWLPRTVDELCYFPLPPSVDAVEFSGLLSLSHHAPAIRDIAELVRTPLLVARFLPAHCHALIPHPSQFVLFAADRSSSLAVHGAHSSGCGVPSALLRSARLRFQ